MTNKVSTHLSEEDLHDVLIGMSTPEADTHLAQCQVCRDQLEQFHATIQVFNQASLAWSEARPAMKLHAGNRFKFHALVFAPVGWALAAVALLAIGVPVWKYDHRSTFHNSPAPVTVPEDSEAQIAQDNDLLQSVNAVLTANEASPLSEYHLTDRPHPRVKARPELRNR